MPDGSFWTRAPPWKKGLFISLAALGTLGLLTYLTALLPFDGMCGNGLFFSARHPCSLGERALESLGWLELMVLLFWPVVLTVLVAPPLLGALAGRLLPRLKP
jgi:hypothetical protein